MKYFDDEEFACKHCGKLPPDNMSETLLDKLDELREKAGYPIYVTSGYRCEEHNRAIGGVDDSQHVRGNAADIYCNYLTVEKLYELAKEVGFDGIGLYVEDGFIHVDTRNDGRTPNYYRW